MGNPFKPVRVPAENTTTVTGETYATLFAIAALAKALDEKGVLPAPAYREELAKIWNQMDEEHASGSPGAVFELLISIISDIKPREQAGG